MIRTANEKYLTLKNGEPAIFQGQRRVNENGEIEALMLCFMSDGVFRDRWVQSNDLK